MYSLIVLKALQHPDGRIFQTEHNCHALDAFEVAELVTNYPEHFQAADDITSAFLENKENVAHLAAAVENKRKEKGELKARKK